jgi:alkanesulfonate monooxygenase SsuD/methylene tetrahydromethanopterin reductase-like flavin-dependent oxidoreductase (luciferase family)
MSGAVCDPRPVQSTLPIWIGGGGERRTLRIAARFADGWNVPFIAPDDFAHKREVLHRHCEEVGRDPSEIRCAVNVGLAWREADFEPQFGAMRMAVRPGVITGSDEEAADRVGRYIEAGADQVNIAVRAPFDADGLARLASVVGLSTQT